ncbi:HNH endonuclease [Cereibacter sphaeroides]|nr:HNH endonuclease [Cereibacter sphaeroides]
MARLKQAPGRLATMPSRLACSPVPSTERERHRHRDETQPWRRWYKTARWQRLRWSVLVRDLFTCQREGCGRLEADTSLLVADHKIPHRGDEALFWDAANLQCLCKTCHDRDKQREERRP